MRVLCRLAAALCALLATVAHAQTFTVDDLLDLETAGQAQFTTDGRWLVIQTFVSQKAAGAYNYDLNFRSAQSRLRIVDLARPAAAKLLFPSVAGVGYTPGPISPSGKVMLVNRLRGHRWQAGLLELSSRHVRWLDLAVDLPVWGRSAAWRDQDELVAIAAQPTQPSLWLRAGPQVQDALAARWAAAGRGEEAVTRIGSGRFLDRGGDAPVKRLVSINARSGRVRTLAQGEYYDLEMSPDGRFVAAARLGADIQPKPEDRLVGASAVRERRLDIVDLRSGAVREPCSDCDITSHLLTWSPASDAIMVYARAPGAAWETGHLVTVSATTSQHRQLTGAAPAIALSSEGLELVQGGWIDGQPWTLSGKPDSVSWRPADGAPQRPEPSEMASASRLIILPNALAATGAGHLRVRGSDGAWTDEGAISLVPLSEFGAGSRVNRALVDARPGLWARRGEDLLSIAPDGTPKAVARLRDDETVLAAQGDAALIMRTDTHGVAALVLIGPHGETNLLQLNSFLEKLIFGSVRAVHHQSAEGKAMTSWLMLPPQWKAGDRPPVVALPYPGWTYGQGVPAALRPGAAVYHHNAQIIASHGYAVLLPSLLHDETTLEPGQNLAREILVAVDAADAGGWIDGRRVALWGQSFGGYAVLMAATQSNRFSAIVATAAATDLSFSHGRLIPLSRVHPEDGLSFVASMGWAENGQAALGAPPWKSPERYWRNSPRFQVDKISAPILLAYGDLDIVGLDEGEAMFSALYREGKDARLLTLWGEGHVILSPGNMRRLYREALAFLDETFARPASVNPASGAQVTP